MFGVDTNLLTTALVVSAASILIYRHVSHKHPLPLPPGPPGLPIIGNLLDMPKKEFPWKQYAEMGKKYGDCLSLTVMGQVLLILNSHTAIKNVVLTRAASFNGRPFIKFVEMAGWDGPLIPFTSSKKAWRDRRKVVDNYFRQQAIQAYQHVQYEKAVKILRRFLEKPNDFRDHAREYNASVILSIVYGYDVQTSDDRFVELPEEINRFGPSTILPGALIVNTFPILGNLPPWMLGKDFVEKLEKGRTLARQILYEPFDWLKEGMKNGTARESLCRESLEDISQLAHRAEAELIRADAFGNIYSAASDTTVSTLCTFFLTMVLFPHIQVKAREELDRMVGRDRLPEFEDRPNLPYLEAIAMEVTRWAVVTPLGVPHTAEEDIIAEGFFIPKGTIVMGNAWAILHDEDRYPEPEMFKPERHLSAEGKVVEDPLLEYAFGFGTRKCPGRYLAEQTTWLLMAFVLSAFKIVKAKDENGNEIPVDGKYEPTMMVHHPMPFKCTTVPRDDHAREVIARPPRS